MGLSVKTLRLYHEKGVLVPSRVDDATGYRYYSEACVEQARVVVRLRDMEFSLQDIRGILDNYDDEADILDYLEQHNRRIQDKMSKYDNIKTSIERILENEREAVKAMANEAFEVEEKQVDTMLIAGNRFKGKYCDCGKGFAKVGRAMGRHICGKPFCLYYDGEYRPDDADIEACMPVRKGESTGEVSVRELPGGRCAVLLHKGPYEELGRSYEKILAYVKEKGYETQLPSREVYIKGPGMILKGNPKKYMTEIQILIG